MWYVHFLGLRNSDLYDGSTDDLKRRFTSHSRGQVLSQKTAISAPAIAHPPMALLAVAPAALHAFDAAGT
jgi:hypothetical protein